MFKNQNTPFSPMCFLLLGILLAETTMCMNSRIEGEILGSHAGTVTAIAFNPQDTFLASGSCDAKVKLWDVLNKTLKHTLPGHLAAITNVQFDRTGTILASASHDGVINTWRPHTGELLRSFHPGRGAILSIEFCPCEDALAIGYEENAVDLVNPVNGILIRTIDEIESAVRTFAWSPDGQLLACATIDDTIRVYDVRAWQILYRMMCRICSLKFSINGSELAGITENGIILLWNIPSYSWHRQIYSNVADNAITGNQATTFNDTGDILACPSDTKINLYNAHSGAFILSLAQHTEPVQTVAFNHAGSLLASGSADKNIMIWKSTLPTRQILALAAALLPRCGQNSIAQILNPDCLRCIFENLNKCSSFCDPNPKSDNIFIEIYTFFLNLCVWIQKNKCFQPIAS